MRKVIFGIAVLLAMSPILLLAQQSTNKPSAPSKNKPAATTTNKPAATTTNAPGTTTTNTPAIIGTNTGYSNTNEFSLTATPEELEPFVLKPYTNRTPIAVMPSTIDREPTPPLSEHAKKHEYLGFRLGMTAEEANLIAQTEGKKFEEIEKGVKYQMEGCLTNVPKPEKSKTVLLFKEGKTKLIMLFWDDNNSIYVVLEPSLKKVYGKPAPVDELFRRYWFLENGDCIRLFYNVAAHQTSLMYGNKKDVFDQSEKEKPDTPTIFPDL